MHKSICVADIEVDEATANINRIINVHHPNRLPIGVAIKKGIVDRAALNHWWIERSIPASRHGISQALEQLNVLNPQSLITKSFGLSLSDHYWIKPYTSDLIWEKINLFDNVFSEDVGDILFGAKRSGNFSFYSPDNTSDGCLKKRWKIIDGKRCLIKGSSLPFMQQPFNEVIASIIMQRLNIFHVPYTLTCIDGVPYSVCEDFINTETELVSAWRIFQSHKKSNNTSLYTHYVNCCKNFGLVNISDDLDQMIVLDYIISNEDRHFNNFGLIRNPDTLEWLSVAPIFDSGTSLGYNKTAQQMLNSTCICKPFKNSHCEQLKLVKSFDWFDPTSLIGLGDDIRHVFSSISEQQGFDYDEDRINVAINIVNKHINEVSEFAQSASYTDDTMFDVEENIAETYLD